MLRELVEFFTTPCPAYVRNMGYLMDAIAIAARHRRCSANWAGHLDHSKEAVRQAIAGCGQRRKAVVLGSGFLLDLPLEELSAAFQEVVLVDIVHLRPVRRRVRAFSNVRLVSCDITGIAEKLYANKKAGWLELPEPHAYFPDVDEGADLVISLNVLTQVSVIPEEYVTRKLKWKDSSTLEAWEDRIMARHYEALARLACFACLITDYEAVYRDRDGGEIGRSYLLGSLRLPKAEKEWIWDIAPLGEESRKYSVQRKSGAFYLRQWNSPGNNSSQKL
jgi:hypothetical protein